MCLGLFPYENLQTHNSSSSSPKQSSSEKSYYLMPLTIYKLDVYPGSHSLNDGIIELTLPPRFFILFLAKQSTCSSWLLFSTSLLLVVIIHDCCWMMIQNKCLPATWYRLLFYHAINENRCKSRISQQVLKVIKSAMSQNVTACDFPFPVLAFHKAALKNCFLGVSVVIFSFFLALWLPRTKQTVTDLSQQLVSKIIVSSLVGKYLLQHFHLLALIPKRIQPACDYG